MDARFRASTGTSVLQAHHCLTLDPDGLDFAEHNRRSARVGDAKVERCPERPQRAHIRRERGRMERYAARHLRGHQWSCKRTFQPSSARPDESRRLASLDEGEHPMSLERGAGSSRCCCTKCASRGSILILAAKGSRDLLRRQALPTAWSCSLYT